MPSVEERGGRTWDLFTATGWKNTDTPSPFTPLVCLTGTSPIPVHLLRFLQRQRPISRPGDMPILTSVRTFSVAYILTGLQLIMSSRVLSYNGIIVIYCPSGVLLVVVMSLVFSYEQPA